MTPGLLGLGRVSLDYSQPHADRSKQKAVLEDTLRLLQPRHTLVLHIRGGPGDRLSSEPFRDCLEIVRRMCPKEQRIHVHCFAGDVHQVREWLEAFPNCFLGITGKVFHFGREQREALRRIPTSRLFLETDAPYLPMMRGLVNTSPKYVCEVARIVATVRMEPLSVILRYTLANGIGAYGKGSP